MEKETFRLCVLHSGFVVPNSDLKIGKDSEMAMSHRGCSGLALTSQNRAAGWEKDCDLSGDEPPFC